jgi:hypothetical protein
MFFKVVLRRTWLIPVCSLDTRLPVCQDSGNSKSGANPGDWEKGLVIFTSSLASIQRAPERSRARLWGGWEEPVLCLSWWSEVQAGNWASFPALLVLIRRKLEKEQPLTYHEPSGWSLPDLELAPPDSRGLAALVSLLLPGFIQPANI